jgi:hypothetical protein
MRFVTWAGFILVGGGIALVVMGFQEKGLAKASSDAPETMSLEKLIARGPSGNPNVILTDFTTCDNFIYEKKKGRWTGAWVPVVPRAGGGPKGGSPAAFKAIVYSSQARSEDELYRRCDQAQLRGMVINTIRSLDSTEKRLLSESYPQTDFSTCIIFQEGREPASDEKVAFFIFGGGTGALIGLGLLVLALFLWRKHSAEEARLKKSRKKGPLRGDEDDDEDDRPRKRRIASDDEDDDRPRKRRRDDDQEDERPRKRRPVARDADEDDRPRRRSRRDDDEDDRPRRRQRDD